MNQIQFVLEKLETADQNRVNSWQGVADKISDRQAPLCNKGVCPECVVLIRDSSELPNLCRAIFAAEEDHFAYKLVVISKDGFEWTRKP